MLQRSRPGVLDRAQPVTDAAPPVRQLLNCEVQVAGVDIRRQDRDAHPAAFRREMGDFGGIVAPDGQQGGHVLDRVVRFEEGRLAGDHSVVGGVRLIEPIPGEILDVVEDRLGGFRVDAVLRPTLHEDGFVLQQVLFLLLGDRPAHQVSVAQ